MPINTKPDIHQQVICANCFIRKNGKYLVLRRSKRKKYAPGIVNPVGGKLELGENPYICAVREVHEETGVEVKNLRLEAVVLEIEPVIGEPYNWLVFHFSADYKQGRLKNTPEGQLIWLTGEELKAEELFPSVKLVIEHILDDKSGTIFATFEYDRQKQNIVKQTIDFCGPG